MPNVKPHIQENKYSIDMSSGEFNTKKDIVVVIQKLNIETIQPFVGLNLLDTNVATGAPRAAEKATIATIIAAFFALPSNCSKMIVIRIAGIETDTFL